MLSKIQNQFQSLLIISALLSATLPITPAKSQTIDFPQKPLQNNSKQPEKLSQANLVAEDVKPSVVRVAVGCKAKVYSPINGKIYELEQITSYGSGFFVNPNGYITTNAHVTKTEDCQQIFQEDLAAQLSSDGQTLANVEAELKWIETKPIQLVYLPNQEQLPFEIINSGAIAGEGKDISIIKINVINAPTLKLAESSQVKLLDSVTVVGYPGLVENSSLFNDESFYEASFTRGQVSAKKNLKDGTPILQITAPVPKGNSGGPVLNENGEVIGLVTFGPDDNFTFLFTSNTIQEFLDSAKVNNQQGLVNQEYRQGLQLYRQGNYTQALQKFQVVKRLFPQHSEVKIYLDKCQQIVTNGN
ncbi:trypsin-like peptidase domain-containing protein [Brunnivagina elsteri]|uniref:Serine protease n=1 Tax=Brunnivagina elsteri CCALA 953 TaxID=987040 RepID=A0A2A2TDL4_9CYAN|nr:trypsin-like peptidase domain-containing protein [Calothrix elsteri]PAX51791.1 serine protease [Calothrix elsteri CCALA 953]